jgi:hypothetical protein
MIDYGNIENRRFLFQDILKSFPDNPWVIQATNRMKSYSKEEYLDIVKSSYSFQDVFDSALQKNIKVPSKEAEKIFLLFIDHVKNFIDINEESYSELIELCKPSINQFLIVNKLYSEFLLKILIEYKESVL